MAAKVGSCRVLFSYVFLAAPAIFIGVLHRSLKDVALYSEEDVLNANVLHPLFNSDEHYAEAFWKPSMKQSERLEALTQTIDATSRALGMVGIPAFLESASLIGWMRHNGGQLPWDTDGDVGMMVEDCKKSGADKAALQKAIGEDFLVLKFACSCEEDCEGDNLRMAGRVTHKGSGVCIDIFAYAPVKDLRKWQKNTRYEGVEWWERVDDHADYTFPRSALLPLQNGTFAGRELLLPADPYEFLSWEYGRCLGVHLWPWRLMLYTPVSFLVLIAIVGKGSVLLSASTGSKSRSPWLAAGLGAYAAAALAVLQGGIAVLALLVMSICELIAVMIRPDLCVAVARRRYSIAILMMIAVLIFELRGSLEQLLCQVDDFYVRPRRPKAWTLCILGQCWDFE
eukprot:TRINITY_DN1025_c0_g2_i1.p1 TRINITY_DN1025_c0_g2~~TRINITY_DN1025_c0_g2_i1.p1  ORF type:complete len:408 (+),score=68.51 TRINITY_DN1025_c0_g2_i1:34-1224(+)